MSSSWTLRQQLVGRHQDGEYVSDASSASGCYKFSWHQLTFVPFKELPAIQWPQEDTDIGDATLLKDAPRLRIRNPEKAEVLRGLSVTRCIQKVWQLKMEGLVLTLVARSEG
jgi:hypothetical protein